MVNRTKLELLLVNPEFQQELEKLMANFSSKDETEILARQISHDSTDGVLDFSRVSNKLILTLTEPEGWYNSLNVVYEQVGNRVRRTDMRFNVCWYTASLEKAWTMAVDTVKGNVV